MAAAHAGTAKAVERLGMGMIEPTKGLAAISGLLLAGSAAAPTTTAVPFFWGRFLQRLTGGDAAKLPAAFDEFEEDFAKAGPLVDEEEAAPKRRAGVVSAWEAEYAAPKAGDRAARVKDASSAPRRRSSRRVARVASSSDDDEDMPVDEPVQQQDVAAVQVAVQECVTAVLGQSNGPEDALMSAGLDSLGAVELRNALQRRAGVELPGTLVFDYPTITSLATFIGGRMTGPATDVYAEASDDDSSQDGFTDEDASMSSSLWSSLAEYETYTPRIVAVSELVARSPENALASIAPTDALKRVPLSRWDLDRVVELNGGLPAQFGGWLSAVDRFDAAALGVSASESAQLDPQQRLLLEVSLEATLRHPELLRDEALRADWGAFVGVASSDYARIALASLRGVTAYSATSTALSVVSGRLAYAFRLKGPAASVDTACSSSLVATHFAFNSLLDRQSSLALAAGVTLALGPETPAMFQRAGMLSPAGRCRTLDADADGYVRGEAVQSLLLHGPTAPEVAAPYVLLVGSAVNQDGRSSTLTAPNGPSQQQVLRAALLDGDVAPGDVGLLQMHGTGTPLGDPIEVGAVAAVFVEGAPRDRASIALTASKSWIGHSEPSAGLSGVTQAALSLTQAALPAILHLREVNQYVCTSTKPVAPGTLFFFGWG